MNSFSIHRKPPRPFSKADFWRENSNLRAGNCCAHIEWNRGIDKERSKDLKVRHPAIGKSCIPARRRWKRRRTNTSHFQCPHFDFPNCGIPINLVWYPRPKGHHYRRDRNRLRNPSQRRRKETFCCHILHFLVGSCSPLDRRAAAAVVVAGRPRARSSSCCRPLKNSIRYRRN